MQMVLWNDHSNVIIETYIFGLYDGFFLYLDYSTKVSSSYYEATWHSRTFKVSE